MSTMLIIAIIALVLSAMDYFDNTQNKEAGQFPRFLFYVASIAVFGFGFGQIALWCGGVAAGIYILVMTQFHITEVPHDSIKLGQPLLFAKKSNLGIVVYRQFFAGWKFVYPLESIVDTIDLKRDTLFSIENLEVEFKDTTGTLSGSVMLRPNPELIQEYASTGKTTKERDEQLISNFRNVIKSTAGDALADIPIRDAMKNKKKVVQQILGKDPNPALASIQRENRELFETNEKNFGVTVDSLLVSDINFSAKLKEAFEQQIINDNINEAVKKKLLAMKITEPGADATPDEKKEYAKNWQWAHDQVMANLGNRTLQTLDFHGLEHMSDEGRERVAANTTAEIAGESGRSHMPRKRGDGPSKGGGK